MLTHFLRSRLFHALSLSLSFFSFAQPFKRHTLDEMNSGTTPRHNRTFPWCCVHPGFQERERERASARTSTRLRTGSSPRTRLLPLPLLARLCGHTSISFPAFAFSFFFFFSPLLFQLVRLLDSWPYYLNNLVRFCDPDFVPTVRIF